MRKGLSIKTVIAIGIGAAVFMVLARFAAIPTPIQILYLTLLMDS